MRCESSISALAVQFPEHSAYPDIDAMEGRGSAATCSSKESTSLGQSVLISFFQIWSSNVYNGGGLY